VVVCLEQDADLHMAQLMPLPLTVSCCSKIQIGFTLLVPAHLGSPEKRAIKRVCVCVPASQVVLEKRSFNGCSSSMYVCTGRARQGGHGAMHTADNQVRGCVTGILLALAA